MIDATCAEAATGTIIVRGPAGFWGNDLFFIGPDSNLKRLHEDGTVAPMGTCFGGIIGFAFGPDGALCASHFDNDLIWRIAPTGSSATPTLTCRLGGAGVVVSWPLSFPDWKLKRSHTLGPSAVRTGLSPPYRSTGADFFREESPSGSNGFFLLRKP